jgi:hypothetical protein
MRSLAPTGCAVKFSSKNAFQTENISLNRFEAPVSFDRVLDIIAIIATVAFFAVALAYVRGCNLL